MQLSALEVGPQEHYALAIWTVPHCLQDMGGVRPPRGSCRAGAIVPMLALNGSKVPVRLDIKSVEQSTSDHTQRLHIVKVRTASVSCIQCCIPAWLLRQTSSKLAPLQTQTHV